LRPKLARRAKSGLGYFRLCFAQRAKLILGRVAKVLQPIRVGGVLYRVLRLDGDDGPRYLHRSAKGDLVGLFPFGAEPSRLYAAPLEATRGTQNPFARFDFFDMSGSLSVADAQQASR
jgi:hypothetical protein